MVHACCAYKCQNRAEKDSKITFHSFPSQNNQDRFYAWVRAVRRQTETGRLWIPSIHHKICSEHFLNSDFKTSTNIRILKENAVPSIFPHHPPHLQKNVQSQRPEPKKRSCSSELVDDGSAAKHLAHSLAKDHSYSYQSPEQRVKDLEDRVTALEKSLKECKAENKLLKERIRRRDIKCNNLINRNILMGENVVSDEEASLLDNEFDKETPVLIQNELETGIKKECDFYTHDHWSKLPHCVKEYVDATHPPDWAWLLEDDEETSSPSKLRPPPLILLALKTYSRFLSLRRTAVDLDSAETISNILNSLEKNDRSSLSSQKKDDCAQNVKVTAFQPANYKNGQCMDMQHIFRKHVKPKKQHEIQKLGQVINLLSEVTDCKSVIDVGAGLGHLSRFVTFRYGLKVTTIEADDGHAPKASDYDRELKKDVAKKCSKVLKTDPGNLELAGGDAESAHPIAVPPYETVTERTGQKDLNKCDVTGAASSSTAFQEEQLPNHVVCRINCDIASSQLLDIVKRNRSHGTDDSSSTDFILTGLHACGDLSPSLLRIFLDCPSAKGLASVACCYMKMEQLSTDKCDPSKQALDSYPMSDLLKNIPDHYLNYESREMACHFADAYCQRLKDNPTDLRIHSYRAALQYVVTSVQPSFQSGKVRLVTKKGAQRPFTDYASETLKKLRIDVSELPKELLESSEDKTEQWKRVVAFYTIRLSLAPVVEALILLDRILFLKEKGINSVMVPIFDSQMSPRNFVILAAKSWH